jgi:uncharacterized membrane protein YeiB
MSNEIALDSTSIKEQSVEHPNTESNVKPIAESERISVMDILRGFALLGILFMNIEWFNRPVSALMSFDFSQTGADYASSWLVMVFVQGKFYKLFALLFGMGFAVMLVRAQEKQQPFGWWFTRRMFVLFAIGLAHMVFFWGGDILHDYAVGGLFMLLFMLLLRTKRLSKFNNPTSMVKFGLGLLLVPLFAAMIGGIVFGASKDFSDMEKTWQERVEVNTLYEELKKDYVPEDNIEWPKQSGEEIGESTADASETDLSDTTSNNEDEAVKEREEKIEEPTIEERAQKRYENFVRNDAKLQREVHVIKNGSYSEVTDYRIDATLHSLGNTPFMALFILLPIFLIGYWFVASGKMRNIEENKSFFQMLAWIGLPVGLMINIGCALMLNHPATQNSMILKSAVYNMYHYGQLVMMFGLVGFVILASLRSRVSKLFNWMAPMGRMALTNYIMHSIILTTAFYNYGLGLFGQISRSEQMLWVVAIIAFQAIFSAAWLRVFKFGPLEWVWRSLTYMKLQPIMK